MDNKSFLWLTIFNIVFPIVLMVNYFKDYSTNPEVYFDHDRLFFMLLLPVLLFFVSALFAQQKKTENLLVVNLFAMIFNIFIFGYFFDNRSQIVKPAMLQQLSESKEPAFVLLTTNLKIELEKTSNNKPLTYQDLSTKYSEIISSKKKLNIDGLRAEELKTQKEILFK